MILHFELIVPINDNKMDLEKEIDDENENENKVEEDKQVNEGLS